MAGKDKFSNEVEEQIQSLARDVYILIEEKLTHFDKHSCAKRTG
jgi:hypothetical protein